MLDFVRRRPLLTFFVLAYLGSWLAWSPWWLSSSGIGVLPFQLPLSAIAGINQLGLFAGPFAAAILVTRVAEGRADSGTLLRRLLKWRAGLVWYLLALVAIPIASGVAYLLTPGAVLALEGGAVGGLVLLASTYLIYLLGGPLQEELGWRGFALPRLQEKLHPMTAALVLGVIHCFWHTPLFLTDEWDTARQDPSQLLAYLLAVVSLSFVLSWLTNGSGGSVLLAVLGHNGLNWAFFVVATFTGTPVTDNWPAALGLAGLALVGILATRGRLGFPATAQGNPVRTVGTSKDF